MSIKEKISPLDITDVIETIEETNRKLASIQRIIDIKPIEGADRIEVAQIQGFQCVIAKKDNFKIGDLVVYFECDSILPERPEFEFMRERKFKVKIIKLRKQISEGLVMPLSILPPDIKIEEGLDLTKTLNILKYDPESKVERALIEKERRSAFVRFLMGIRAFRYMYLKLNTNVKGNWPQWIKKSDQIRIQTCFKVLSEHYDEEWYISEKIDGQSLTAFSYFKKVWGRTKLSFGLCSRNIWIKTPNDSRYWQTAKKLELEKKLKDCSVPVVLQAEQAGPGIQANKYQLKDIDLFVFGVYYNGKRVNFDEMIAFCNKNELKTVSIVNGCFIPSRDIPKEITLPSDIVQYLVKMSEGNSKILNRKREGLVFALKSNPDISFKVINPQFLLEEQN